MFFDPIQAEFKTLMAHKGRMSGYTDIIEIESFIDVMEKKIDDLKLAKCILVYLIANPNTSSSKIEEKSSILLKMIPDECTVLCDFETDEDINESELKYSIIISGLKRTKYDFRRTRK